MLHHHVFKQHKLKYSDTIPMSLSQSFCILYMYVLDANMSEDLVPLTVEMCVSCVTNICYR